MTSVVLVSNSPGEVSTYVKPIASELRRRHPTWRLFLALVPCPYATGAERRVVESWGFPLEVWSPGQTAIRWLTGKKPEGPGVVGFLGGDPWHALLLKQRFKFPAVAYFPEKSRWIGTQWLGGFDASCLGYCDPATQVQAKGGGLWQEIGDLRVDAVLQALESRSCSEFSSRDQGKRPVLALFPGSRWLHLKAALGPFLSVAERLSERHPEWRILLSASPYLTREQLASAALNPFNLGIAKSRARLMGDYLLTEAGCEIEVCWNDPYRVIGTCQLALSLPGTNTAELAIAGKPTVIPLSTRVPVGGGGLLGVLDRLPGLESLKRRLKARKAKKLAYIALPNQIAGRKVVPEFYVRNDLEDLFDFLSHLLDNAAERDRIGREARAVMGPPGSAERFVDMIETILC